MEERLFRAEVRRSPDEEGQAACRGFPPAGVDFCASCGASRRKPLDKFNSSVAQATHELNGLDLRRGREILNYARRRCSPRLETAVLRNSAKFPYPVKPLFESAWTRASG
jgi:hypothetical protein